MIDARISVGLPSHPKTKKLIRRVGEGGAWRLVCLFLWVAQTHPDGDLSGMTGEDIELASDWQGEEGAFISALVEVGFIDGDEGQYQIHDWHEHNPWAAGADARSEKARFNALCKHHGRAKAAEMMPEYAARMHAAWRSSNDSATSMHAAENSTAPSPSPSPSPYPSPSLKEKKDRAAQDAAQGDALPADDDPQRKTSGTPKRAAQLPEDFEPDDTAAALAFELGVSLAAELPKFRDYHAARGKPMKDWQAALRTWLRNAKQFARPVAKQTESERRAAWLADITGRKGDAIDAPARLVG